MVWAEYEVANRILGNFLHDQGITQYVVDVRGSDPVAVCRPENLHLRIVLRNPRLTEGI